MKGLETLLTEAVQPLLKNAGFRRKGYIWNRDRDRFVDVIEFQLGKASRPGREQFTINAGVFVPEFWELIWQGKHSGFTKEVDCAVRGRVGQIVQNEFGGKAVDKWWRLETERVYTQCLFEIPKLLTGDIIPFLEQHKSIEDIHKFLTTRGDWQRDYPLTKLYLALASLELGDREGAELAFQALMKCSSKAWAERAKCVKSSVEN